ncbi:MAG: VCBS repeat-containing protein, partial [Bryobacteraceae bacterium]
MQVSNGAIDERMKPVFTTHKTVLPFLLGFLLAVTAAGQGSDPTVPAFDRAEFIAPGYTNGAVDTFLVGTERTLNYSCHCAQGIQACEGWMRLDMDGGTGFVAARSAQCSPLAGGMCSGTYTKTFSAPGTYRFRVACVQPDSGLDAVQQPKDYVALEVASETCTPGARRLCPLQAGVCSGATQSCVNGFWGPCGGFSGTYEPSERTTTDGQDNDCDGKLDENENQVLISNMQGDGSLDIFEYDFAKKRYDSIWSVTDETNSLILGGGVLGDVNHDGSEDIILIRHVKLGGPTFLEVWSRDVPNYGWRRITKLAMNSSDAYVGAIGDFDKDGKNEFILIDRNSNTFEVWGTKTVGAETFTKLYTIHTCVNGSAWFHKPAADLDGDGTLEIVTQCSSGYSDPIEDVLIHKWTGTTFAKVASVPSPIKTIDHSGIGDIDGDGKPEAVVCGNSNTSHVLSYKDGNYRFVYTAPVGPVFTQSCGVGDLDGDGRAEWFDVGGGQARVFGYRDGYKQLWQGVAGVGVPPLGSGFAGDVDHDGVDEFIVGVNASYNNPRTMLWKYVPGQSSSSSLSFENTYNFPAGRGTILIGHLLSDGANPEIFKGGVVNSAK